jgi:hypothetical protein
LSDNENFKQDILNLLDWYLYIKTNYVYNSWTR